MTTTHLHHRRRPIDPRLAATSSLLFGALVWLATGIASGGREAWDSPLYVAVALPLLVLVAASAGVIAPHGAWRWGLGLAAGQGTVLILGMGSATPLAPMGWLILAMQGVVLALFAEAAAFVRRGVDLR